MYKFLKGIILVAVIAACIMVSRTPLLNIWADLHAKYFPCQEPITYSIGRFDPKFGISKDAFLKDVVRAEEIWEKPFGKDFFVYKPDGMLKINLIYDYRQDATNTLKKLGLNIDNTQASYKAIKAKYDLLQANYLSAKIAYEKSAAQYNADKRALDQKIQDANKQGGLKGDEYDQIIAEQKALAVRAAELKKAQDAINAQVETINSLVVTLNHLGQSLNMTVDKFNQIGTQTGAEFDEAIYTRDGTGTKIDVYQYNNNDKLIRVLAHELGHALGIDHVNDPTAIMYRLNQSTNIKLSADDIAAVKAHCKIP